MKPIARTLGLALAGSLLAGWLGTTVFRGYADYLVPTVLLAATGGVVGAVAGLSYAVSRARHSSC